MIRVVAYGILSLIIGAVAAEAMPVPPDTTRQQETDLTTRLFINLPRATWMHELRGSFHELRNNNNEDWRASGYATGWYFNVLNNLQAGAFYRLTTGERYDRDWVSSAGNWSWADTRGIHYHEAIADISPRFLLTFLPGKNWLLELKVRAVHNIDLGYTSGVYRPSLTYFVMRRGQPLWNLFVQYENLQGWNYARNRTREEWVYTGFLLHVTRTVKFGMYYAWKRYSWFSESDFEAAAGTGFRVKQEADVLGINLTLHFDG